MAGINVGRVIVGGLVAGLVMNVVDGVANGAILGARWEASTPSGWSPHPPSEGWWRASREPWPAVPSTRRPEARVARSTPGGAQ